MALVGAAFLIGTAGPVAAAEATTVGSATGGAGAGKLALAEPAIIRPIPPQPIDENEAFLGFVNGKFGVGGPAVIQMACPPGFTGHPVAGQTVEVARLPAGIAGIGSTGAAADSIQVDVETEPTGRRAALLKLTDYNVTAEIPTSLELPCSGSGSLNFIPTP